MTPNSFNMYKHKNVNQEDIMMEALLLKRRPIRYGVALGKVSQDGRIKKGANL